MFPVVPAPVANKVLQQTQIATLGPDLKAVAVQVWQTPIVSSTIKILPTKSQ